MKKYIKQKIDIIKTKNNNPNFNKYFEHLEKLYGDCALYYLGGGGNTKVLTFPEVSLRDGLYTQSLILSATTDTLQYSIGMGGPVNLQNNFKISFTISNSLSQTSGLIVSSYNSSTLGSNKTGINHIKDWSVAFLREGGTSNIYEWYFGPTTATVVGIPFIANNSTIYTLEGNSKTRLFRFYTDGILRRTSTHPDLNTSTLLLYASIYILTRTATNHTCTVTIVNNP